MWIRRVLVQIFFSLCIDAKGKESAKINGSEADKGDSFEQGELDAFAVDIANFNDKPRKLILESDDTGKKSKWYCNYVLVSSEKTETVRFDVNNWIGDGENNPSIYGGS